MISKIKTNVRKAIDTGFIHIFVSGSVSKIIAFFSGVIIIRILSKSDYGIFSFAYNIYGFIILFSGLGLSSSFLQLASEKIFINKRNELYNFSHRNGLAINLILSIVIVLISLFVKLPIAGSNTVLLLFVLLPLFEYQFDLIQMRLRVELNNKGYSFTNMSYAFFSLLFAVIFSLLFMLVGKVIALYLSLMFSIIVGYQFIAKEKDSSISNEQLEISREDQKSLYKIGFITVINGSLSKLMYLIDIFILGLLVFDEKVIASYKVATIIPTALLFIPLSVVTYFYPHFAKNKDNPIWLKHTYRNILLYLSLFNFMIVIIMISLSYLYFPIIFGNQYNDAIPILNVLLVSFFIAGTFRTISGNLLITQRKLIFNLYVSAFSAILNVVLNIVFIKQIGPMGAAIATLITVLSTSFISTLYLWSVFNKKYI